MSEMIRSIKKIVTVSASMRLSVNKRPRGWFSVFCEEKPRVLLDRSSIYETHFGIPGCPESLLGTHASNSVVNKSPKSRLRHTFIYV